MKISGPVVSLYLLCIPPAFATSRARPDLRANWQGAFNCFFQWTAGLDHARAEKYFGGDARLWQSPVPSDHQLGELRVKAILALELERSAVTNPAQIQDLMRRSQDLNESERRFLIAAVSLARQRVSVSLREQALQTAIMLRETPLDLHDIDQIHNRLVHLEAADKWFDEMGFYGGEYLSDLKASLGAYRAGLRDVYLSLLISHGVAQWRGVTGLTDLADPMEGLTRDGLTNRPKLLKSMEVRLTRMKKLVARHRNKLMSIDPIIKGVEANIHFQDHLIARTDDPLTPGVVFFVDGEQVGGQSQLNGLARSIHLEMPKDLIGEPVYIERAPDAASPERNLRFDWVLDITLAFKTQHRYKMEILEALNSNRDLIQSSLRQIAHISEAEMHQLRFVVVRVTPARGSLIAFIGVKRRNGMTYLLEIAIMRPGGRVYINDLIQYSGDDGGDMAPAS